MRVWAGVRLPSASWNHQVSRRMPSPAAIERISSDGASGASNSRRWLIDSISVWPT